MSSRYIDAPCVQQFQWLSEGTPVPLHGGFVWCDIYSGTKPLVSLDASVDDADKGLFSLELDDSIFAESDTVSLVVKGMIPGSTVCHICRRVARRKHGTA